MQSWILKKWIEPIYKNFYYLDRGLKRYYLRDETVGMKEANDSVNNLKTEIEKHPGTTEGKLASQLKENKQKVLTNDWSVDILNELLNK